MTVIRTFKRSESEEQRLLFEWAALMEGRHPDLKLLYAVPNGGKRHIKTAIALKAEGVKPGVPDLCLPVARQGYHGLYIEMKSAKGRTSETQDWWLKELNEQLFLARVCRSFEEARDLILDYLNGKLAMRVKDELNSAIVAKYKPELEKIYHNGKA